MSHKALSVGRRVLAPAALLFWGGLSACSDDSKTFGRATILSTRDPDATGNAQLVIEGSVLSVRVNLKGLPPNTTHASHIHRNFCPPPAGPGPEGPIVIPLNDITAGDDGAGSAETTVDLTTLRAPVDLLNGDYYLNVHERATTAGTGPGITCGRVVF